MRTQHSPKSAAKVRYRVAEVADLAGLSAHVIRVWEMRYGWPKPDQGPNGFRYYSESLASTLKWVGTQIQRGRTIGAFLRDPLFPQDNASTGSKSRSERGSEDFCPIADPVTEDGIRLRRALEQAFATNDQGAMARIQAESQRLNPTSANEPVAHS
jgi:DNA-binding transcriptional MerR regulator